MLAEVQAANAALSQIMNLVKHGQDISEMAGSCATYFNTKAIIARTTMPIKNITTNLEVLDLALSCCSKKFI